MHTIMAAPQASNNRTRRQLHDTTAEQIKAKIQNEVFNARRGEIQQYLKLFGYKPEKTILQVHLAGYLGKGRRNAADSSKKKQASSRYGGTTFVVVGRSHDPAIMGLLIKPKKKPDGSSLGYIGYLWKDKNRETEAPHELLPLDFTPTHVPYPQEWKDIFATKGFMIAMHVPSAFAPQKNRLNRALYSVGKSVDVKKRWYFLDDVKKYGYHGSMTTDGNETSRGATESQTSSEHPRSALA